MTTLTGWRSTLRAMLALVALVGTIALVVGAAHVVAPAQPDLRVCAQTEDSVLVDCTTGDRLQYDHHEWHRR